MHSLFSCYLWNAIYGIVKLLEFGHSLPLEWLISEDLTVFLLLFYG